MYPGRTCSCTFSKSKVPNSVIDQTLKSTFWRGSKAAAPFIIVVIPFGMLFGVIATESGLDIIQTMAMTSLVIAGAAQFTALQLLNDQAPVFVAILTGLAVNARMAMYSASMVRHMGEAPFWQRALASYCLVDQTYGTSILEYEKRPDMTTPQKMAFFFGASIPICTLWYIASYAGAVAGQAIPEALALDFAVPITFISLFAPMLRTAAHVVAAFVSVTVALLLAGLPFNSGLIVAAFLAMFAAAWFEIWMETRA